MTSEPVQDQLSSLMEACRKVRAFLEICNFYPVKHTNSEEQYWKILGLTLDERDEALSALAQDGELEFQFYYSGRARVRLKSKSTTYLRGAA